MLIHNIYILDSTHIWEHRDDRFYRNDKIWIKYLSGSRNSMSNRHDLGNSFQPAWF